MNFQVLEGMTHCSLEGVRPWGGKYICLKELDKFLPLNNLEFLRIRDCLAVEKLEGAPPVLWKLKFSIRCASKRKEIGKEREGEREFKICIQKVTVWGASPENSLFLEGESGDEDFMTDFMLRGVQIVKILIT